MVVPILLFVWCKVQQLYKMYHDIRKFSCQINIKSKYLNISGALRARGALQAKGAFRPRRPFGPTHRSSRIIKICLWTKFQPSTWILAPTGSVFLIRALNKLPLQRAPSKNKPRHAVRAQKQTICPSVIQIRQYLGPIHSEKPRTEGTYMCYSPHKTPLKKVTSSLRSEVNKYVHIFSSHKLDNLFI